MPGKVMTATDYRNRRAFKMMLQGINPIPTGEIGEYRVQSQGNSGRKYTVKVLTDQGHLVEAHCTCPDWRKMHEALVECIEHPKPGYPAGYIHPGVDHIEGSAVCKHVRLTLMSYGFLEPPAYTLDIAREVTTTSVAV